MIQKLTSSKKKAPERPNGFQAAQKASPQADLPSREMTVRVIEDWRELAELRTEWLRLVQTAIEPNIFYEPHVLLPALEHLADSNTAVVVVEAGVRVHPDGRKVLCGLFPVRRCRSLRGLPFSTLEMWRHDYCFLTTPLIREDVASETINAFLTWQQDQKQMLLHLPLFSGGGDADRLFSTGLDRICAIRIVRDQHSRATVIRRTSTDDVLHLGFSRKRRHEARRNRRKLEGEGELTVRFFESGESPEPWIENYLRLETSGWKGRVRSDICGRDADRRFFEQMITEAANAGRLMMICLQLDGKTIAMKINLPGREGVFCFKIAYDERYARYSPGVLLEMENLDWLHRTDQPVVWMDSCAQPGHTMIENIWPDRREITSLVIPSRRRMALFAAASIPLCRAFKRPLQRRLSKTALHPKTPGKN